MLEMTGGRVGVLAESFLGLRHGPMSAVHGDTLVVAFLSPSRYARAYELDVLRELGRKGLGGARVPGRRSAAPGSRPRRRHRRGPAGLDALAEDGGGRDRRAGRTAPRVLPLPAPRPQPRCALPRRRDQRVVEEFAIHQVSLLGEARSSSSAS